MADLCQTAGRGICSDHSGSVALPAGQENMRCIRLNTLIIFLTEHAANGRGLFASVEVEGAMSGRLLGAV